MEIFIQRDFESQTNVLISTISTTKSGKDAFEAATNLVSAIAESCDQQRRTIFENRGQLNKLSNVLWQHIRASKGIQARFKKSDEFIFEMLSQWEQRYSNMYPIFDAWLSYERGRGLPVPCLSAVAEELDSSAKLRLDELRRQLDALRVEAANLLHELTGLLSALTPSLEEAFDNVDSPAHPTFSESESLGSHLMVREEAGVNSDLFKLAREKLGFVSKKTIPKLLRIAQQAESFPQGSELALSANAVVSSIQSSRPFIQLMLLLSDGGPRKKRRTKTTTVDQEYDDWFS